jgi:hypothetical protein
VGAERQRKAADGSPRAVRHAGALWVEPPWGTRLSGPPCLEGVIGGVGLLAVAARTSTPRGFLWPSRWGQARLP